MGKPYEIPLNATDPGGDGPPIIAIGGLINVAQRFDFMSLDLMPYFRLISLDFAGRGRSGWMAEQTDYTLEAYVEQLRQLMDFLKFDSCILLVSSLGGSIALRFAANNPDRVRRNILNDSGPFIPLERRARDAHLLLVGIMSSDLRLSCCVVLELQHVQLDICRMRFSCTTFTTKRVGQTTRAGEFIDMIFGLHLPIEVLQYKTWTCGMSGIV